MIAANSRCASAMITDLHASTRAATKGLQTATPRASRRSGMARTCTQSDSQGYRSGQARRTASRGGVAEGQSLIDDAASTIHGIDTGTARGYSRALFVSNLAGRLSTYVNHGNVEIIDRAVARLRGVERQSQETCRHGTPFNLQVS